MVLTMRSVHAGRRLVLLLGAATLALVPTGAGQARGSDRGRTAIAGPYLTAIAARLNVRAPETDTAGLWSLSDQNTLPAGWLLQTPSCWGRDSCAGATGRTFEPLLDRMRSIVAGAQLSVDIANLSKPNGGFLDAILDGLHDAASSGHRPLVRILLGLNFPKSLNGAAGFFQDIQTRYFDLTHARYSFPTELAFMRTATNSWEHTKALIADGRVAMLGGMNYWSQDYLQEANPVNDVSMVLEGPAAEAAHRFESVMWGWACSHLASIDFVSLQLSQCVSSSETMPPPLTGHVPVLTVGRLGQEVEVPGHPHGQSPDVEAPYYYLDCLPTAPPVLPTDHTRAYEYRNPGEIALRALIMSARHSVFLSQQDLLSCIAKLEPYLDDRVFTALATKIAEQIPVTIVLSNRHSTTTDAGSGGSDEGYSNGYSPDYVMRALSDFVHSENRLSVSQAQAMVCKDVRLATIRSISRASWANGKPFANHAKVVAVDDAAFYIGSENLYPAQLQELGFIVEDPAAAALLRANYLEPLWRESEPDAIIDPATGRCREFGREYSRGWEAAFQTEDHHIAVIGAQDFRGDTGYSMAPGTSPSIAAAPTIPRNGWVAAYQADTHRMAVLEPNGENLTKLEWQRDSMAPDTSPSITYIPDHGFEAAFQASDHHLMMVGRFNFFAGHADTGELMAPGTSPSIVAVSTKGQPEWDIAYQTPAHRLAVLEETRTGLKKTEWRRDEMTPDSSPSITYVPGHGFEAAFRGSNGHLFVVGLFDFLIDHADTGYSMAPHTSPSVAAFPNGEWRAAFRAATGRVWMLSSDHSLYASPYGAAPDSSPSVTAMPTGAWEISFQAEGINRLWVIGSQFNPLDMGYLLDHAATTGAPSSSPSIGP
jgi:phosphatidylserine/phosphatidylglycerophosphate/cardiolipin synthase-like enzyme